MASLHRQEGKPHWFCAYSTRDARDTLRRHFRSTGTTDKKQALQICNAWANASLHGTTKKLNADKAREIIAGGVADVLAATGNSLPSENIRNWCNRWLEIKALEVDSRTHERYADYIRRLFNFLGTRADRDLDTLRADDVIRFRDAMAHQLSIASTNLGLKVIRSCLGAAVKQDLLSRNEAAKVSTLRQRGEGKRRAFTKEEVRRVIARCNVVGGEWIGLALAGLYTGQRLGDLARLTWQQVDLQRNDITFLTEKGGKRLSMRLAKPLAEHFESLPSADDPASVIFPEAAAAVTAAGGKTGTVSNRFYAKILAPAGLVPPRPHRNRGQGKGKDSKRTQNELSFHSFRHTLTTWLKATGASNAIAQMIIGHDSEVVSRNYTHLGANDTADAIAKLPDVTRGNI